jgi:hypothetical protein
MSESSPRPSPGAGGARFASFREFYPFYLGEHRNPTCRKLHFAGSTLVLVLVAVAIATANAWWLVAVPFAGYGFAWVGHFFYEKNRPATFTYPLWSLAGDWVMYGQLLTGKIRFDERDAARQGAGPA